MCCTISQSFALTPSGVRLFNLVKMVWPARPRVGGIPRVHGNFSHVKFVSCRCPSQPSSCCRLLRLRERRCISTTTELDGHARGLSPYTRMRDEL